MIKTLLVSGPATEPVSLADAKAQLRIDGDDHNTIIAPLISSARTHIEDITNRALITQTLDLYLDAFPGCGEIELPKPPLIGVDGIFYTPSGSVEQTFASGNYLADSISQPGRIVLVSGASWPGDTLIDVNAVRIRFRCGYGTAAADVPLPLRQAILLIVSQWFDNPLTYEVGPVMPVPFAVDALIAPYRVVTF